MGLKLCTMLCFPGVSTPMLTAAMPEDSDFRLDTDLGVGAGGAAGTGRGNEGRKDARCDEGACTIDSASDSAMEKLSSVSDACGGVSATCFLRAELLRVDLGSASFSSSLESMLGMEDMEILSFETRFRLLRRSGSPLSTEPSTLPASETASAAALRLRPTVFGAVRGV